MSRFRSNRRAVSTLESIASLAVMAILLAFVAQWTTAISHHRRTVERQRQSVHAIENLLAIAMATPYEKLTTSFLEEHTESLSPRRTTWKIEVENVPAEARTDLEAKRIVVAITYGDSTKLPSRSVVAWKYPTDREAIP